MLFNSLNFIWFFIVVTSLYFALPYRARWGMLLIASCFFYMAFIPAYILILFTTIIIDYYAGIKIEDSRGKKRDFYLIGSIVSTCLVLFIFKYFNFFNTNFARVAEFFNWSYPISALKIILPIGLSFHTFQSLSYVIEVYRGNQKAERHFGIYSLFVMFYPQLVAGPIERPQNLLHQFHDKFDFDYKRVTDGLKLMAWGMFKKVVIADRLALYVNEVYGSPGEFGSFQLIIGTIFFAYQIYCDFSGYSDIAIGSAQVMGFKLMTNFRSPYFSRSVSEFWKRWHISLSTWFKDYVYIPLGGNRVSKSKQYMNLGLTFLISGFWHGANWTFIFWGGINGMYLIVGEFVKNIKHKLGIPSLKLHSGFESLVHVFITFCLICLSWIFFRANNVQDAFYIIKTIFTGFGKDLGSVLTNPDSHYDLLFLSKGKEALLRCVIPIVLMEAVYYLKEKKRSVRYFLSEQPLLVRHGIYYFLLLSILFLGQYEDNQQFIYFQF